MAGGSAIDGGAIAGEGSVLSHVRCDTDATHLGDKDLGVVVLGGIQGLLVVTGTIRRNGLVGSMLPSASGLGDLQSTIRAWRLSMSTWLR